MLGILAPHVHPSLRTCMNTAALNSLSLWKKNVVNAFCRLLSYGKIWLLNDSLPAQKCRAESESQTLGVRWHHIVRTTNRFGREILGRTWSWSTLASLPDQKLLGLCCSLVCQTPNEWYQDNLSYFVKICWSQEHCKVEILYIFFILCSVKKIQFYFYTNFFSKCRLIFLSKKESLFFHEWKRRKK